MKYARLLIVPLLLLFLFGTVAAQDGFVVMSVKGKVEVKSAGKGAKWSVVKVGDVLKNNQTIRTSFASYVKLMAGSNRLLSVDENSTTRLSALEQKNASSSDGSASGRLLAYAAKQVKKTRTRSDEPVFGAVRGNTEVFSAVFPKYQVMTTEPLFEWVDADKAQEYQFVLLNDSFDVVTRSTLKESRLKYGGGTPALAEDRQYYWRITRLSDGMESDIQSFRVLPADTIAAVREELARLDEELGAMGADSVTLHLIRAIYFERKGLYTDAFAEYKETVRLAPEVQEYREMLRGLLFQLKLYAEEEYLLP